MSRLPRLHADHENLAVGSSAISLSSSVSSLPTAMTNLKRKAMNSDDDDQDRPRKLPAIQESTTVSQLPLRPLKTATNINSQSTKPASTALKPPTITNGPRRVITRATSAPPKSSTTSSRLGTSSTRPTVASRNVTVRSVSSTYARTKPAPPAPDDENRLQELQNQMTMIESARAADAARLAADMESERAKLSELQANHLVFSRELAAARSQEVSQKRELMNFQDELDSIRKKHARELADLETDLRKRDRKVQELEEDLRLSAQDLSRERSNSSILKATISEQSTTHVALKAQINALQAQLTAVQASCDSNSSTASGYRLKWEDAQRRAEQLEQDLQDAEMSRRRLHNMVQELKGNIRVFCRVRPVLPFELPAEPGEAPKDPSEVTARIEYPDRLDHKEIVLNSTSESATGLERKETWQFTFDRVFEPHSTQSEVFEDISQLAQSCIDGYNVCIFAYGQTGSGKSFTMEGGISGSTKGMIPRAVEQVFQVAEVMGKKGWEYKMEGQFLEIYNETINDLLGTGELDKKKHEIKHDKTSTRVTDLNVIPLHSATQVQSLLSLAKSRRTVAATLMNERSSRSHSVFTLRISGKNLASGDSSEGSLNLVDLAGSERLEKSGAGNDKDRLKETQNINKSLSALGDVIAALGEKGDGKSDKHIPYRNSKLTYLLQHSLSGNSKTLMVLNLSPLSVHMNESLCSLRFATKVNNTNIGTAKKITKASS